MKTRERGYKNQDWDYFGIAGVGDIQYDDGFDDWNQIKEALKDTKEIKIKTNHLDDFFIGSLKYWSLDEKNKSLYVGFNKNDLNREISEFNQVSISWIINDKDEIIGVDHVSIGNSFEQKCPKEVCDIKLSERHRSDPPAEEPEVPSEDQVPEAPEVVEPEPEVPEGKEMTQEDVEKLRKSIEENKEIIKKYEEGKSKKDKEGVKMKVKKEKLSDAKITVTESQGFGKMKWLNITDNK